jgi:hypothetical protein
VNGICDDNRRAERWLAQIEAASPALGLFDTAQAAHDAHIAAKAELHTGDLRQRPDLRDRWVTCELGRELFRGADG